MTGAEARLSAEGLRLTYGTRRVVDDVSFTVRAGRVLGVVGPNGSGKTSVLRLVAGDAVPEAGSVVLDGRPVEGTSPRALARSLAVVAQDEGVAETPLSAAEMVMLGRNPHLGPFQRPGPGDIAIVEEALRRVGALDLARREVATLSGGERQRVLVARALAQGAGTLLLDEPTNHLDVRYQHEVLGLVRSLGSRDGTATVVVLHDLNLAARYCDDLLVLDEGRVAAYGVPDAVLVPEVIEPVYAIGVHRLDVDGVPHLAFHPAHETHGEPHEHLA
ncbi:MAG: ABC transporter ATP-binding protein [Nocardioides sp.]|nr:ABC transporter ATP-binding protein [Nocardioides sp.]